MRAIVVAAAGLTLLSCGGFLPCARAALPAAPPGDQGPPVHEVEFGTVRLSPIVVNGRHIPFPIALQMVKKALKRPWSSDPRDRNKLVCYFQHMFASHFQTMICETNGQYFSRYHQTQAAIQQGNSESYMYNGRKIGGLQVAIEQGLLQEDVGSYMNQHPINRGQILSILKHLPPAGSSYTLRVMDHGKVVEEYVIKDGKLVSARIPDRSSSGGG